MHIKAIFRITAKREFIFDGDNFLREGEEDISPLQLIDRVSAAICEDLYMEANGLDFTDITCIGRTPEDDAKEELRRANADKLLSIVAQYVTKDHNELFRENQELKAELAKLRSS